MKPIWIDGDAARLEQVFVNLLHNATNYTNSRGLIRVTVRKENDEAVVVIQDNGIGADKTLTKVSKSVNNAAETVGK